jgi:hypothetical protein
MRFCRLLVNLPLESRFLQKYIPTKDWDWEKETQSRILMQLDVISCQLSNMFRKKGTKPRKPAEQFQPDYVKEAKKDAKREKAVSNKDSQQELAEIFEKRNNKVKSLEEKLNGA